MINRLNTPIFSLWEKGNRFPLWVGYVWTAEGVKAAAWRDISSVAPPEDLDALQEVVMGARVVRGSFLKEAR